MGTISEAFCARNSHCRALNCDSLFSEEASLWTTDCTVLRRSSKMVAIGKFQAVKGLGTRFCVWTESFLSEHQNLHLLQSLCECTISGSKLLHTPRCVCTTDHVMHLHRCTVQLFWMKESKRHVRFSQQIGFRPEKQINNVEAGRRGAANSNMYF